MNWELCRFGLIVTGVGERSFLPHLFSSLCRWAHCHTEVIRKIDQRSPIRSPKRILRMTGTGKVIPDKDAEDIGLPARRFLHASETNFVLVIDDLEHDRRLIANDVFNRYRGALDVMLTASGMKQRAAVHFMVNMVEAYYFADCAAINNVARRQVIPEDHNGDVEDIRHPKSELKRIWRDFDEVEHGAQILMRLNLDHVLSRCAECCWLRTMLAWCVVKLESANAVYDHAINGAFGLPDGCQSPITSSQ